MAALAYIHHYEPGTDPAAAPLLLLHGTGGDEHDLIALGRQLVPGATLLSPRGDVSEQGRPRFFRRFAEGVFDLEDVTRRAHALADFIRAAAAAYGFDASRLTALGYSNGANMAASLLLLRPESLARAILLRPMVVLDPTAITNLHGKDLLLASGRNDPIVPPDHPGRLAEQLRRGGAEVSLEWIAGGHALTSADLHHARSFLSRGVPARGKG